MKFLTKEWLLTDALSYTNMLVRKSKKAEKKDDDFYHRLYEKKYRRFLSVEQPDCFAEELDRKIKLYEHLPQDILEQIADLRVFALGYASAQVKQLLKPYCAKLRRISKRIKEQAFTETDEAETYLPHRLGVNNYEQNFLMGIEQKKGTLYLEFDFGDKLFIKNGKILQQDLPQIYPFCSKIPNSGWSMVLAAELHRSNENFEIHFLIENLNEHFHSSLGYLTICGTDIGEIIAPENLRLHRALQVSHFVN